MYRQIKMSQCHKKHQRILWREEPNLPIKIYQLATVTYGTAPVSFLATGCSRKLAEIKQKEYPTACEAITRDFYMDDFLSGAFTKNEVTQLCNDLIEVLKHAGMRLSKWSSNDAVLLENLEEHDNNEEKIPRKNLTKTWRDEPDNKISKILGLSWNSRDDAFRYQIKEKLENNVLTKRNMLAYIATVFDPLGLVGPVILRSKLLLQELWQSQYEWDDPLPEGIINKWNHYRHDLLLINAISIPRRYTDIDKCREIQVHGFADASIRAYGACLYLRCINEKGRSTVRLICSKS